MPVTTILANTVCESIDAQEYIKLIKFEMTIIFYTHINNIWLHFVLLHTFWLILFVLITRWLTINRSELSVLLNAIRVLSREQAFMYCHSISFDV